MGPQDVAGVEELRRLFRQELAAPEFTVVQESVLVRLLRSAWELLAELFRRLFPEGLQTGPSPWVAWAFILVGGTLAFLLVRAVRRRRDRGSGRGRARAPGGGAMPRDWKAWAETRAAEGAFRDAATGYYRAALDLLAARGALEYGAWKTPGDYVEEVDPTVADRAGFVAFVADFVTTTFGTRAPGPDSVARLAGRLRSLEAGS